MNKKIIYLLTGALFTALTATAQSSGDTALLRLPRPLMKYSHALGLRLGFGVSNLYSPGMAQAIAHSQQALPYAKNYSGSNVADVGFEAGILLDIPVGERAGIMAEVNYLHAQTSYEFRYPGDSTMADYMSTSGGATLKRNQLYIPVLFRYTVAPRAGLYIFAGPAANLDISGKIQAFETIHDPSTQGRAGRTYSDTAELVSGTSFHPQGIIGIGFLRSLSGKPLHIQIRYATDLTGGAYFTESPNFRTLFKGGVSNFTKERQDQLAANNIKLDNFRASRVMFTIGWAFIAAPRTYTSGPGPLLPPITE